MTDVVALLIAVAIGFVLAMTLAWAVQKQTGQSGWIDAIWTYSLGLAGVVFALWPLGSPTSPRQGLVAVLVALWSLRLGTHVVARTLKGGDDPRYARLKQDWGNRAQPLMFLFLMLQALAGWLMAIGVLVAARAPRPSLDWQDCLGGLVLLVAVLGEGLADEQLRRFAQNPANKGKVCDTGLWRWSRHPNYFFEWLGWLTYPVIAIQVAGFPWGWIALLSPLYIYYLLVHVSGIPPLEEHMMRTRPEAFAPYRARTSAFFPAPPKPDGTNR